MNCPYCRKNVVGHSKVVMILGEGPAHSSCHEQHTLSDRSFNNLHFPSMTLEELYELKEMVLVELNARNRADSINDEIELFA